MLALLLVSIVFQPHLEHTKAQKTMFFGKDLGSVRSFPKKREAHRTIPITIHKEIYTVVVADTPVLRTQGLSDTSVLPYDGMLFVFDAPSKPSFWMKDMQYALDFVWLDSQKKVVDIHENITPETYPNTITPKSESQYVLELKAGFLKEHDIKIGEQFVFSPTPILP